MKPAIKRRTILSALAAAASLIILTTACADSPTQTASAPRAAVSEPAPTVASAPEPTASPEPTVETATQEPASAPEPTASPEPTVETATQEPASAPEPTASPEPTVETATQEPASAPEPTASPEPTQAAPGSAAYILQIALTAMNALSSYHAEMEHVLTVDMLGASGDVKTVVHADVQEPDKMGGDMTITLTGEPPIANGFVIIGDDGYVGVEDPDNPQTRFWIQSGTEEITPLTSFITWFKPGSDYEFTPATLVGTEDLDGEKTLRMRGSFTVRNLPDGVEQPEDMEADVWIGTTDSLIRKVTAAGEVEEMEMGLEIAISYSRFDDAAIQVEAPATSITP